MRLLFVAASGPKLAEGLVVWPVEDSTESDVIMHFLCSC